MEIKPPPFRSGPQLIIRELMKRLPGTVITHDMGDCKLCAQPTESGAYLFCIRCLRQVSKGLLEAMNHISEYSSLTLEAVFDKDAKDKS